MTKNKTLAEHHDGGLDSQGGAQQGTGARGEQYLDGPGRSHKIARKVLFGTSTVGAPKHVLSHKKISLSHCPFFRSKRTAQLSHAGLTKRLNLPFFVGCERQHHNLTIPFLRLLSLLFHCPCSSYAEASASASASLNNLTEEGVRAAGF